VALGDWSYSLYLLHFTVMCCVAKALQVLGAAALDPVSRSLLLCAITTAITIPLSALTYRLVELPGIALGNRFGAALGLRRAAATAGA
jgi:peptidoglycan/LPS O-acetylase OafA/YrhL